MQLFRQPDPTTCGAAVLVRARMLADPVYDRWLRGDRDPGARFADEAVRTHRRTNRPLDGRGRIQAPWPLALGTQPWALARELSGSARVTPVLDRSRAWERIVRSEQPVAVYVGNRLLPRHVVLVVGRRTADLVDVYEPHAGSTVPLRRAAFVTGSLALAGWDRAWATIV